MLINYFIAFNQLIPYQNSIWTLENAYYLSAILGVARTFCLLYRQFCFQKEQLILNKSQKKINQT